jgi:hypothetical protein
MENDNVYNDAEHPPCHLYPGGLDHVFCHGAAEWTCLPRRASVAAALRRNGRSIFDLRQGLCVEAAHLQRP